MEKAALAVFLAGCGLVAYDQRRALVASFEPLSSPIDWCEVNYEVTPYVVEFWNSLSSLMMCVIAGVAPRYVDKRVYDHEPGAYYLWGSLAMVGVGSTLFHGTLSVAGQVMDELPISLLAMFSCFMLIPPARWNARARAVCFSPSFFVAIVVSSSLACILMPVLSHVFCVSWVPIVLYMFSQEYRYCSPEAGRRAKHVFRVTLALFGLAATSWVLDRLQCEQVVSVLGFNPQLHAWWHVFISLTFWGAVATGIVLRCYSDGLKVELEPTRIGMPYVAMAKVV